MSRYYSLAALLPALVSIVAATVYSGIINRDYKSEWMTAGTVITIAFFMALFYSIVMCLLSLSILFVANKRVRNDNILTFLSWFLLPGSLILISSSYGIFSAMVKKDSEHFYWLVLNIPYVVGLIWSYLKYKKCRTADSNANE